MPRLEARLQELERRAARSTVPAGLTQFYELNAATIPVGGADALLARLDDGTGTQADRAAVAAVPGGLPAIRQHVACLQLFYGGVLEYESDEHLQRTIADAEAAGFRGCVIALPDNARGSTA